MLKKGDQNCKWKIDQDEKKKPAENVLQIKNYSFK